MMPNIGDPPEYWLVKTTHQNSVLINGATGFFYVFYKGDAVQVCTVETSMIPGVSKHLEFTEKFALAVKASAILPYQTSYSGDAYDGYLIEYVTDGLRPGFIEASGEELPSWTATFNCAGNVTPALPYNRANAGRRIDIANKTLISVSPPSSWTGNFDSWTIGYGYYPQSVYTYDGYGSIAAHSVVRYDISFYDYSDAFLGTATIVIPFYDAEAAYLQSEVHVTRVNSGHQTQREENYNFVLAYQPQFGNGTFGSIYLSYESQNRNTSVVLNPFSTVGPATTESELSSNQLLAHRAGIAPAAFGGDVARYFDPTSDYVQTTFKTLSSVSASTPVVLGRISPVGASGISIGNLALVGWI